MDRNVKLYMVGLVLLALVLAVAAVIWIGGDRSRILNDELSNSSNWPYNKTGWIYEENHSADYKNAKLLAELYIYQKHGWKDAPDDPRYHLVGVWPYGVTPRDDPRFYMYPHGEDVTMIYMGIMNGSIR